ncbi:MAG: phosphatase PAP2 family protein [Candidatus Daviesbacteria bacterium]|nr:MAG: phosphatase PAP2 family protein [Candidatus Daviesbacteria bacterium]
MKVRLLLLFLAAVVFLVFVQFSYTVAKESWQQIDFDTTVKIQDKIPRRFDEFFSIFSVIGSVEITVGFVFIGALLSLIRFRIWASLAWLLVLPATVFEIFGKLVLFHPGPPVLFHRNVLAGELPSFYVHTNFSYPSGHMTRTAFIVTILCVIVSFQRPHLLYKLLSLTALLGFLGVMFLTRIYLGEHWLSDVVGGTLLGVASGLLAAIFIVKFKKYPLSKA